MKMITSISWSFEGHNTLPLGHMAKIAATNVSKDVRLTNRKWSSVDARWRVT